MLNKALLSVIGMWVDFYRVALAWKTYCNTLDASGLERFLPSRPAITR